MTAAVEMPIVVEVDEVYQGLATGLAGEASRVPAALLSCPGCEHSILPWPQRLPALFTGAFFKLGRYQAGHPLSQGLPPPPGTEEPQFGQLLLLKGQAISLIAVLWRELLQEGPEPRPAGGLAGVQVRVPQMQNFRILVKWEEVQRMEGMLVSEGRAGLLPPEQRPPQGPPLASGLGCCLG